MGSVYKAYTGTTCVLQNMQCGLPSCCLTYSSNILSISPGVQNSGTCNHTKTHKAIKNLPLQTIKVFDVSAIAG